MEGPVSPTDHQIIINYEDVYEDMYTAYFELRGFELSTL